MSSTIMVNQSDDFNKLDTTPIIANQYDVTTLDGRRKFDNMLLTVYEGNSLKPSPQCSCIRNPLRGRFRLGELCPNCGDVVSEVFTKEVNSNIWLVPLPETPAFVSPLAWYVMQKAMKVERVDCLKYICDPFYKTKETKMPLRLRAVQEKYLDEHGRGLSTFYEHFDGIMDTFINQSNSSRTPPKLKQLDEFIKYNRDNIFTTALPVPNRVMFPIEQSGSASYGDKNMVNAVNAVRTIQEAESKKHSMSKKGQESRMVKCIELFTTYHFGTIKELIGSKYGMARQHVFGGRWHFSSRAVVVSIHDPHDFRTVYLPWVIAVEQFRIQLVNKLLKRNYSPRQAYELLQLHATMYSEVLDELFHELIEESPYIGLPIILQRNPTIRRPSAVMVYVTKVKTDCRDHTISISVGNLTGMNADFDGDQLNTVSLQDAVSHDRFEVLSPDHNVADLSTPWALNDTLKLQPPVISTASSWLANGRKVAYGRK